MGTNYLAPTWRQPKNTNKDKLSNYSIDFDTIDGIVPANNPSVNLTSHTVSAWIKPNGSSGGIVKIHCNQRLWYVNVISGGVRYTIASSLDSTTPVSTTEWTHVVVSIDQSVSPAVWKIYQNGVETATKTGSITIGSWGGGSNEIGNSFDGKISQVCLFDYALSDGTGGTVDQISYLYNLNNPMAISGAKPIAYWPLGDNSNPVATAGYPNVSVGSGSVFDFDGTDIILADPILATGPINSIDGAISISSWFKTTASGDTLVGRTRTTSAAFSFPWVLYTDNSNVGKLAWALNNTNGDVLEIRLTGTTDPQGDPLILINDGSFHNVVATYDGSNTSALYIDGVLQKTVTVADFGNYPIPTAYPAGRTCIGGTQNSSGGWPNGAQPSFVGEVSNVQIWNTKIESSEVTTLYNNGQPLMTGTQPQATNLKGWWKLNQSANWEADTAGNWQIPDAVSSYPQSFSFNGVDDQINLGLESDLDIGGASKYSTSLWFKKVSNGTNCFWGYNYGDPSGSGFYLWQSSGAFRVAVGNNSLTTGFGYYNIVSANVPIGEWINVVVVFDGTLASGNDRIKVYQNGELATGTYVNGSNFPATLPNGNGASNRNVYLGQLQLANGSFSYSFDGKMSNVMQWTTDLSLSDATAIYNNGVPLPTASVQASSLKAWYKLDNTAIFYPTQQYWGIPNAASTSNILNFSN